MIHFEQIGKPFQLRTCRTDLDLGNNERAFFDYLAAALLNEDDPEAWVNAVALAFTTGAVQLIPDLVATASRFTGDRFMQQLVEFARSQGEGFPREEFLATINAVLAALPDERDQSFDLRVLGKRGNVETFAVPRP